MTRTWPAAALCTAIALLAAACTPVQAAPTYSGDPDAAAAALAELDTLTVLDARPTVAGGDRSCSPGHECFWGPAWTDDYDGPGGHDGCDSRNQVLAASLQDPQFKARSRCVVIAGRLADPYSGSVIEFVKQNAGAVQIDHVVPLALAHDLGAHAWSYDHRVAFANDQARELLAVSGHANQSKGDRGPSQWLPPNKAFACTYVARFVDVLDHYRLPITRADRDASRRVLTSCANSARTP